MATIAYTRRTTSLRIPSWLGDALLIIALALALLILRPAGLVAPDVTSPVHAPGAPDLAYGYA